MSTTTLAPVRRSITVQLSADEAFRRFTEDLGGWWPLERYAADTDRAVSCGLEPGPGGRLFETWDDGSRHVWGTVSEWEPARRLGFSWHPGREEESAQEVQVEFVPEGERCRVTLTFSGWERLGERAPAVREGYEQGIVLVLDRYAGGVS